MTRRRIVIALSVPLILIMVGFLILLGAELLGRAEPTKSNPVSLSSTITIQADERLFTLMAALNAADYDDENNDKGMHPVRQAVRAELARKTLPSLERLRPYMQMCRQIHESNCVHWILQRDAPPTFARQAEGWWVNAPALLFNGFDVALRDFYVEADLAVLWRKHKPAYDAEAARYQALLDPALQTTFAYLKVEPAKDASIVLLPNLLDAYWRGYGPSIAKTSYIINGPAEDPNIGLLQHEAMHPIINPLVDANLGVIDRAQADQLWVSLKPRVPQSYQTWDTVIKECVIRAIQVRLLAPERRERAIVREEQAGMLLVRPLTEQLADYEKSDRTISEYMPKLLQTLNRTTLK